MNKKVKKQHYISRAYLQEFSTPSKSKDLLWVRDNRGQWRPSRPENEGFENDFQSFFTHQEHVFINISDARIVSASYTGLARDVSARL